METGFTRVMPAEVADSGSLACGLSVRQWMFAVLKRGALDLRMLAEEVESNPDTVSRTVRRYKDLFVVLEGGRVALLDKR
jgi:hypothetical protein